ncbi:MAG: elongation factor P [Bacteroidota bacterium]|nr:MAG: elongation factor P [Bacteroidota bacterium]
MATTADIRNGLCMLFNNDLYTVVEFQHVKPGKGPAFVRTKLKNIKTGKVIDNTFSSGHKIDVQRVERRPYQFLYSDDMGYNFMHNETFEQITIEKSMINAPQFLKEGDQVEIVYHADNDTPLFAELLAHVALEVTYTEPGLRGDTASSTALKPATLETGAIVNVPLFVNMGDKIKVDTRDGSYVERVK